LIGFQKHHPKFIAKKELLRWVPSVSIYLRHSGAAVIDRKSGKEAVTIIAEFGKALTAQNASACIFPEGTRTRDGKMKPFKIGGVASLLSSMPNALVVPVAISGTYALTAKRFWPVPVGVRITVTALQPIEPHGLTPEEVVQRAESQISSTL
jgi:1-acyl-sn-glycerol-3-phosphate acyltransferase